MASEIVRQLTPEEEELLLKREELAAMKPALAERELELADLPNQLAGFQGRYMRQVGILYAELDEWRARIAELRAKLEGSGSARERAAHAREQARATKEAAEGEASRAPDFQPSADLKALFRETAKRIHPDFAKNSDDVNRRTQAMVQANEAYRRGDVEALRRILDNYQGVNDSILRESIGDELVRIIRQIAHAKKRLAAIEQELSAMRQSEIALFFQDAETAQQEGRDLLAELATATREQIAKAKKECEVLSEEVKHRG